MGWQNNVFNQLIVIGANDGIFIYDGNPGPNALIGSWTASAGTDPYGNPYPAGINVTAGSLTGVSIASSAFVAGTIMNALITGSQIQTSQFNGGAVFESVITFDSTAGGLFLYATTTTTTSHTSNGTYSYTALSSAGAVSVTGAGSGGDGGSSSNGGVTGGAGAFAAEPAYPLIEGNTYQIIVGNGGNGGVTGQPGQDGGDSSFDNQGVYAFGGNAGSGSVAGTGGAAGPNTIAFKGGDGAIVTGLAGAGGGSAGSAAGAGHTGFDGSGNTAGNGGAAVGTGGVGGAGGTNGNNGNNGGSPGGAGGGAGAGSQVNTFSFSSRPTETSSYYGSQGEQPNVRRNTNGSMYQGAASGDLDVTGDQYSIALYNKTNINNTINGGTVTSVSVEVGNAHSWNDSGMTLIMGYAGFQSLGDTGNLSGASLNRFQGSIGEGATKTFNVTSQFASELESGNFGCLIFGTTASAGVTGNLDYYGYQNGGTGSGPILRFSGTNGTGANTAGAGQDGSVVITETSTSVMVGGISAIANQEDAAGNTLAQGFTGLITAIHPGSSPAVPETWQQVFLDGGWSNVGDGLKYRLNGDGTVQVFGAVTRGTSFTGGQPINSTHAIPSQYWPSQTRNIGGAGIPNRAGVEITAAGVFNAEANGATCTEADVSGFYPLY